MKRIHLLVGFFTLASLVYLVVLFYMAKNRALDADEGYYSTAARLVWEGKTPYRDFFFQQAPLVPYAYSAIWGLRPGSVVAMRSLSAAFGGIAVILWGVCLLFSKRLSAVVGVATFASVLLNPYWVWWNSVVKTFALANLLMSVGLVGLYAGVQTDRRRWYVLGGIALGGCASARLLYGPLVPAVFLWLLNRDRRSGWKTSRRAIAFTCGAACGLFPLIATFSLAPSAFIFSNIRYHAMQAGYHLENGRAVMGHSGIWITFLAYVEKIGIGCVLYHPYFAAELGLALAGALSFKRLSKTLEGPYTPLDYTFIRLVGVMIFAYVAAALIPFPPYNQYFHGPLVPLLIPFVAEGLRRTITWKRRNALALAGIAAVLFAIEIKRDLRPLMEDQEWSLSSYRQVARAIVANSGPNDTVLSFWSGYVFESRRRYFPGLNDEFVFRIVNRATASERKQLHVASTNEILEAITARTPRLIVTARKDCMDEFYATLWPDGANKFDAAVSPNYSLVTIIDDVEVLRRR